MEIFIGSGDTEGVVVRVDNKHVVQIKGQTHLLEIPGVECLNPDQESPERVYSKTFSNKRIYLPNEAEEAKKEVLGGSNVVVIGMTGYSRLTDQQCFEWGIKPRAYENACMDILGTVIHNLNKEYPGIKVKLVDGASDMGVDQAVIEVARQLNIEHLGYSCPEYLFYVKDDEDPIFVAGTRQAYSDAFIANLDILFSVGGRVQALEHDISAAIRFNKHLILLNILHSLSTNGNPPARDGNGNVVDATAAFYESIARLSKNHLYASYEDLKDFATETSTIMCRKMLSPEISF